MNFVVTIEPCVCPVCGSDQIARITFGYPRQRINFDIDAPGQPMGGCVRHKGSPLWICVKCKTGFIPDETLE